jgi:hypothetical protein
MEIFGTILLPDKLSNNVAEHIFRKNTLSSILDDFDNFRAKKNYDFCHKSDKIAPFNPTFRTFSINYD